MNVGQGDGELVLHLMTLLAVENSGLSARTVQYCHAFLRKALNVALKDQVLARNVASLVDPPRVAAKEVQPLTPQEARQFLEAVQMDSLEALFTVAASLGSAKAKLWHFGGAMSTWKLESLEFATLSRDWLLTTRPPMVLTTSTMKCRKAARMAPVAVVIRPKKQMPSRRAKSIWWNRRRKRVAGLSTCRKSP